jgi:hypothetical protein
MCCERVPKDAVTSIAFPEAAGSSVFLDESIKKYALLVGSADGESAGFGGKT